MFGEASAFSATTSPAIVRCGCSRLGFLSFVCLFCARWDKVRVVPVQFAEGLLFLRTEFRLNHPVIGARIKRGAVACSVGQWPVSCLRRPLRGARGNADERPGCKRRTEMQDVDHRLPSRAAPCSSCCPFSAHIVGPEQCRCKYKSICFFQIMWETRRAFVYSFTRARPVQTAADLMLRRAAAAAAGRRMRRRRGR